MEFKKSSTVDRMLHNYHKFNNRAPKVKPEDYMSIDELNLYKIDASSSYKNPLLAPIDEYIDSEASYGTKMRRKKEIRDQHRERKGVITGIKSGGASPSIKSGVVRPSHP